MNVSLLRCATMGVHSIWWTHLTFVRKKKREIWWNYKTDSTVESEAWGLRHYHGYTGPWYQHVSDLHLEKVNISLIHVFCLILTLTCTVCAGYAPVSITHLNLSVMRFIPSVVLCDFVFTCSSLFRGHEQLEPAQVTRLHKGKIHLLSIVTALWLCCGL